MHRRGRIYRLSVQGCCVSTTYIMNAEPEYKHRYPWSRKGFTLMELLVVIAIILLLAGLLLPAIHKSREKGRQAHCMNNLRQFAIGINLWRQEHDFDNPPWLSSLYPSYIATERTYLCKTDGSKGMDGSKPAGTKADIGAQFPWTDDNSSNDSTPESPGRKVRKSDLACA